MNRYLMNIILICLFGCSSQSPSFFIGKWQILRVVENDQRLDLENNWIHLKEDGSFDSYDGESNETGNWKYESKDKVLYIDGNKGQQDDSKWALAMKNDTLIFSSKENDLYLVAVAMK